MNEIEKMFFAGMISKKHSTKSDRKLNLVNTGVFRFTVHRITLFKYLVDRFREIYLHILMFIFLLL